MSDKTVDNEPKITAETVDKATQSILEKTLALIQCYPQGWEERTPNLRQQIAQESGIPIEILTGRLTQIEDATTELLDASAKAGEDPIKLAALGKLKEKKFSNMV